MRKNNIPVKSFLMYRQKERGVFDMQLFQGILFIVGFLFVYCTLCFFIHGVFFKTVSGVLFAILCTWFFTVRLESKRKGELYRELHLSRFGRKNIKTVWLSLKEYHGITAVMIKTIFVKKILIHHDYFEEAKRCINDVHFKKQTVI